MIASTVVCGVGRCLRARSCCGGARWSAMRHAAQNEGFTHGIAPHSVHASMAATLIPSLTLPILARPSAFTGTYICLFGQRQCFLVALGGRFFLGIG